MSEIVRKSAVILFLSEFKEKNTIFEYSAPDGNTYAGSQSSDAPIRYILSKDSNIDKIFCIVTEKSEGRALEHFKENVLKEYGMDEKTEAVKYYGPETFSKDIVNRLLGYLNPKDSIWFDMTGGFRDISIYMTLLYQTIIKMKVKSGGILYSNFEEKRIKEVDLEEQFNLLEGINAFNRDGTSHELSKHFLSKDGEGNKEIGRVMTLIENLSESMMLCKVDKIEENVSAINEAIKEADSKSGEGNQLYNKIKQLINLKFKILDKAESITILDIVRWCNENNRIQEALTIYVEGFPKFILQENGIMPYSGESTKPEYDNLLKNNFFSKEISMNRNIKPEINFLSNPEQYLRNRKNFSTNIKTEQLARIFYDYFFLKMLRNQVCHANIESLNKELADYYKRKGETIDSEKLTLKDIKEKIGSSVQRLESISNNMVRKQLK